MAETKEYTLTIGGLPHTVLLSDEEAKRREGQIVDTERKSKAKAPANKAATPENKGA